MSSLGQKVSNVLLGTSGGQLLIDPGKMKRLGKSRNDAQLWLSGGESKVQCCKEKYCIGTCNVRSMNQGQLDIVKQEMPRVNVDILGISELKWTGKGEFNSYNHYIYYCGQESLRRNGVAIIVNKSLKCSTYTNTHTLFLKLFSIIAYYRILTIVPYAIQ